MSVGCGHFFRTGRGDPSQAQNDDAVISLASTHLELFALL